MKKDISIDKELFTPLTAEEKKVNSVVRPSVGYWKDAWSRLKSNFNIINYNNSYYVFSIYFTTFSTIHI